MTISTQYSATGTGSRTVFALPYTLDPNNSVRDVIVTLNGVLTETWVKVQPSSVMFAMAPGAGVIVHIERRTPTDRLYNFSPGSRIESAQVNGELDRSLRFNEEVKSFLIPEDRTLMSVAGKALVVNSGGTGLDFVNPTASLLPNHLRTVKEFGAVGNALVDDTPAFLAAIASVAGTGGTVLVPPGHYRITKVLELPVGVCIQGTTPTPDIWTLNPNDITGCWFWVDVPQAVVVNDISVTSTTITSSTYVFTQADVGKTVTLDGFSAFITSVTNSTTATLSDSRSVANVRGEIGFSAIRHRNGTRVSDMGFYYPGQDYNNWGIVPGAVFPQTTIEIYGPAIFAPTFTVVKFEHDFGAVRCFLPNSYIAFDYTPHHERHILRGCHWTTLRAGVLIGRCTDVGNIIDCQSYPYWSQPAGFTGIAFRVNLYMGVFGRPFEIGGSDGQVLHNCTSIGAEVGLTFNTRGGQGSQGTQCTNLIVDNGLSGIAIEAGTHLNFANTYLVSINTLVPGSIVNDSTCFGIRIRSGGVYNFVNTSIFRANGFGVLIQDSAFSINMTNTNMPECLYRGFWAERPGGGPLYRIAVTNMTVGAAYPSVEAYHMVGCIYSYFTGLRTTGAIPTSEIVWSNNPGSVLDGGGLYGNVEYRGNAIRHQPYIYRLTVNNAGAVSIAPQTPGAEPISVVLFDANTLTTTGLPRRAYLVTGEHQSFGGANNVIKVVADAADEGQTFLRFMNVTTGGLTPISDPAVRNKVYFVVFYL